MKKTNNRKAGFTLVEIMIVVAIIGLLAAIAIPNFVRARSTSQQNACINNLRLIDAAQQQYALEKGISSSTALDATGSQIQPYLGHGAGGELPHCPLNGTDTTFADSYSLGTVTNTPVCVVQGTGHGDANFAHVLP